jgi:hypothetical protein
VRRRPPRSHAEIVAPRAADAGDLFIDALGVIPTRFGSMSAEACSRVGRHPIDLRALSIKRGERALTSRSSTIREAQLSRIESLKRQNLGRTGLEPDFIARSCGISTRCLHELFRRYCHAVSGSQSR